MGVFRKDSGTPFTAAPYAAPRGLTAAATRMRLDDKAEGEAFKRRKASGGTQWQQEAWEYYDAVGEVKYAFNLVSSIVSRIKLYAAVSENPAEAPVNARASDMIPDGMAEAAERAIARLSSTFGGQAGLLRDAALNLCVTGECYLVQRPELIGSGLPESWDIRSTDELVMDARGNYSILHRRDSPAGDSTPISKSAFVGRIWRAHPRFSDEADSSMRGILDLCAELLLLNRTFRATARSRLNAGALYLPDGLSLAASADADYPYSDDDEQGNNILPEEQEDDFEDQLVDAMTTPISDESSASAVVPLIIRGPAELADKIKQFKFERSFDPSLAQRADRVLERILQGLDVPKDTVTGLANVKYSNAVQIDESLYKAHIEPIMLLLSDALTVVFLRPYLKSLGYVDAEIDRVVVWYDPAEVSTRNDRAADADAGFSNMAISYQTWRRAHGFSDADAPTPTELTLRLLQSRAVITPELTEAMLSAFAPEVMETIRQGAQANSAAPIPPEVQQALAGQQAAPPAAEEPLGAPGPTPVNPGVAPPEDAPPVPLVEPES